MLVYGIVSVASAIEQKPRTVVVVGAEYLPKTPPLLKPDGRRVRPRASSTRRPKPSGWWSSWSRMRLPGATRDSAELAIRGGLASAVMLIPANLAEQLQREGNISIPIKYNSIDEPSQITDLRLKDMLDRWQKSIVTSRLKRDQKTQSYTEPITVQVRGRRDRQRGGR